MTKIKVFEKHKFKELYKVLCTFTGNEDTNAKFKGDLLDLQTKLKDEIPTFDPTKYKS